jgi:hypothetical protein
MRYLPLLSLLLVICLLQAPPVRANDTFTCPEGTHAEGAAPPNGFELRCVDAEGRAEGPWRTWYDNGQLMSERSMQQGREHGRQRSWWPNGQLMMEGVSYQGARVKGFRFWSITGQPGALPPRRSPADAAPASNTTR